MFITQMEYREKSTATNWKRMQFPLHANLVAEDPALATRLLDHIAALAAFGRNENTHQFINAISRITLKAAHLEFMWFAKSTVQDGQFLVDEEELYAQDNTMLMRRAFAALTRKKKFLLQKVCWRKISVQPYWTNYKTAYSVCNIISQLMVPRLIFSSKSLPLIMAHWF